MGGIFISYRRDDSQGEALHLFDNLKDRFGADRVFMDVTGIAPGKDFRQAIDGAVSACDVLIAIIGKKWIDHLDERGKRGLDDPTDFVRIETSSALRRDIAVIPVLVQGERMPRPDELPAELEALAWRNAFELRHNRWEVDVTELTKALEKILPIQTSSTSSPRDAGQDGGEQDTLLSQSSSKSSSKWRRVLPIVLSGAAVGSAILLIYLLNPERQVFPEPMYGEFRLDACFVWADRCGQEPANEWCKSKGFKRAIDYSTETVGDQGIVTKLIGTQGICKESFCAGFKYIKCER
jgi:hypothetical protein